MDQAAFQQGLEKIRQGDYQGAIAAFDQVLQADPHIAPAYYRRGVARFNLGDLQAAILDYTQALQLAPDFLDAYFGRGLVRLALSDPQGTLEDAQAALHINPNHAAASNLQGTAYRRLGNLAAAIASFKQAAQLYLDQKDRENCRRCLDTINQIQAPRSRPVSAITISPEDFLQQAITKMERSNYREALADFNWLIQVDPQDARVYCYRGLTQSKLGNSQSALQDLGTAMQLAPQDAKILCYRGLLRIELGDYGGAIADFNQLLQSEPENAAVYVNRGQAYCRSGDRRRGIEDYSRALLLQPGNAEILRDRAQARAEFADQRGALEDYQRAANLYLERQSWDCYRKVLDQMKQLQADLQVQQATTANHQTVNSDLQDRLLRMVGGRMDIAERLIDLAKQKYPDMPENWYWERTIQDLEREQ